MAWMLWDIVWKATTGATAGFLTGLFLKKIQGVVMGETVKICRINACARRSARRGMCLVCYSRAKAKIEAGETTWNKLVELGLCDSEGDPFDDAYNRAVNRTMDNMEN